MSKIFCTFAAKLVKWIQMYIYILLLHIAALFNEKAKKLVRGQAQTLKELGEIDGKLTACVWIHAASVGEFEQARPIIERLKREQPNRKIVLTFFSPSGYEMQKDYPQVDKVLYLPFATRRNAERFVALLQPSMAIFVKYEFWPAYLKTLKKNNIPTHLIAAIFRKDQLFFKWYGWWYKRLLDCFTTLFVQDEASKELLEESNISTPRIVVAGDTRFDRVMEVMKQHREIPAVMRFVEHELTPLHFEQEAPKVIVAGSTWPEDEELLARYVQEHPKVKLILVPHEITDEHMHFIFNLFQGRFVRFSEASLNNVNTNEVLLIDRMGMLSTLYRFGQVAYVGGGFGAGIHNTIEAAVYGKPVLFGPRYHNFREAENLIEKGGGFAVHNYESFAAAMDDALAHHYEYGQIAGEYVQSELGATDKIYKELF